MIRLTQLDELVEDERSFFGSKAVTSGLLRKAGFPVPIGFAFGVDVGADPEGTVPDDGRGRRKWIASPEIRRGIGRNYETLRVESGSVDNDVPVAVRSSAPHEDGDDCSYAGQFSTFLRVVGVDAVVAAIEANVSSQLDPEGKNGAYRRIAGESCGLAAVLVQVLIDADWSGVCFSRSPHDPEVLVLETVPGLGENLMGGRETGIAIEVCRSSRRILKGREGLEGNGRAGFSSRAVSRVVELCLEIEAHFGHPVDVEWAFSGEELYLLQARPITALNDRYEKERVRREEIQRLKAVAGGARVLWSDYSASDMHPRLSPLGLEVVRGLTSSQGSFAKALHRLGFHYPNPEGEPPIFECICGRTYYNVNRLFAAVDVDLPLALDVRGVDRNRLETLDPFHMPVRLTWPGWDRLSRLPLSIYRWAVEVPGKYRRVRRSFAQRFRREIEPDVVREARVARSIDPRTLSNEEILRSLDRRVEELTDLHAFHQMSDYLSLGSFVPLRSGLRALYGDRADQIEVQLAVGFEGNFHVESHLALARVAAGTLKRDEFLDQYGHRGSPDWDVAAPRWREQDAWLDALIAFAGSGGGEERLEERRRTAEAAVVRFDRDLARSRWLRPFRSFLMKELAYYRDYTPLRESSQNLCFLWIELIRILALEVGRRTGLGDLLFYVPRKEYPALLSGRGTEETRARARALWEWTRTARKIPLPHLIDSEDLEAIGRIPMFENTGPSIPGQVICAGVARGRVRPVTCAGEVLSFETGEILVAPSFDLSWVSLLFRAGGMILESGGLLSHPAILARELGVPTLGNVPGAVNRLTAGEEVTVDADRGRVLLHRHPIASTEEEDQVSGSRSSL